uniref:sn-1-specific diacylglycerol lipase ABHD11 n=1 Tax=Anopheles epiroticus TaxID=199890 RepID=A0A182PG21_9DIPT
MSDFQTWYKQVPPFTRIWLSATVGISLLAKIGILPIGYLILQFAPFFYKLQLWRPMTAVLFYPLNPGTGFHFMMNCYFLYNYSLRLETDHYKQKPGDYMYMLFFNWILCVIVGLVMELPILMDPMVLSVLYVWCKLNKDVIVNFWFGMRFKAMYLPWVLLGMNMILSSGSIFSLVGIFVGHAYYFLKFSYPSELGGPALIETPFFIKRYFPDVQGGTHGFGIPPVGQRPVQQQQQADTTGFRHAWGRAMFLSVVRWTVKSSFRSFYLSATCCTKPTPVPLSFTRYENNVPDSNAPPVLVLHGLFGSKSNWNSLGKAFHKNTKPVRKIYAIDARNHGDSPHTDEHSYEHMVEDLVHLYQTLGIEKAAIIGHSMGGRAMMLLALKYVTNSTQPFQPQLVEKAIIVDISPSTGLGTSNTNIPLFLESMKTIQLSPDVTIHQARKIADEQLSRIIAEKSLRDFLITNLVKAEKEGGRFRWRINLESLERNFNSGVAQFPQLTGLKFDGPTLFIAGGRSDYVKPQDVPLIKTLFPKAEITYVKDAGHWVHSEKSTEFSKLVLNFLNE